MADGLNKVMVMGNLGQDPELRVTQGGQPVLNISIGVNSSWLDRNRVRQESVEWVRCVIWGRRAEALSKILHKGMQVFVEGSLTTNSYEDREGVKRYNTQVRVSNLLFGGASRARRAPNDPERRASRRDHYDDRKGDPGHGEDQGYDDRDAWGSDGGDDIPF